MATKTEDIIGKGKKILSDMSETHRDENLHVSKGVTFDSRVVPVENLKDIESFHVRHNDIFLSTVPRSGMHWLTEIVLLILADADLGKVIRNVMDQVFEMTLKIDPDREPITGYKVVEGWPTDQPRVMISHLCAEFLPPEAWHKKGAKVIYMARNLLDVLVSRHAIFTYLLPPELQEWSVFVQYNMTDEVSGGSWFHHVLSYWSRLDVHDNLLFLKYEDTKRDPRNTVQEIAKFLERPLTTKQIDQIVELTSFNGMKKTYERLEREEPSKLYRTRMYGVESFLNKGKVCNWKGKYSDEQLKEIQKKTKEAFDGTELSFELEI